METETQAGNCRFGVAAWPEQVGWLPQLGVGWFHDFSHRHTDAFGPAEYYLNVLIKQDKDAQGNRLDTYTVAPRLTDSSGGLGWWLEQVPGAVWIVGNEPDRGPDPGQIVGLQADMMPELYAKVYHDVYQFIKARDPSALVANAGLVEVTPGRLQYLDIVWDTYKSIYGSAMPVDIWNMHLYILPEAKPNGENNSIATIALGTDPQLAIRESGGVAADCVRGDIYCFAEHDDITVFAQQVRAMRTWMRDHGQRHKPLILSEYSIIYPYQLDNGSCYIQDEFGNCFDPERVTSFLENAFNYLKSAIDDRIGFPADGNRLVQQWGWYSIEVLGPGEASNLVEMDTLTSIGQAYKNTVANESLYINLFPDTPTPVTSYVESGRTTTSVTLRTYVLNNGTLRVDRTFTSTFYADADLTQEIGSIQIPAPNASFSGLTGCTVRRLAIQTEWPDLTPGLHEYWVVVDSDQRVPESSGIDNIARGIVIVNPVQVRLPTVLKPN
ncbi:MAG: CARDB domain-containing protein [Chloroflexota bacterium]